MITQCSDSLTLHPHQPLTPFTLRCLVPDLRHGVALARILNK